MHETENISVEFGNKTQRGTYDKNRRNIDKTWVLGIGVHEQSNT